MGSAPCSFTAWGLGISAHKGVELVICGQVLAVEMWKQVASEVSRSTC